MVDQIFYYNDPEAEPPLEVKHVVIDASQLEALPEEGLSHRPELTKIEFQNSVDESSMIVEIGDRAFNFCASLHSIFQMPSTLQRIGQAAFHLCSTLGFLHLPDGIQVIGEGAFESCVSLLTIRIPSSVLRLERATFRDCRQLRSIELPPTLESIGGVAFVGCLELVNIYIPDSVIMERNSFFFSGCTKLDFLAQRSEDDTTTSMDEAIVLGLRNRFTDLPIHEICYYQSYHSLEENLDRLKQMVSLQFYDFEQHVDDLGMSPFHVLSLSADPKPKLAEALTNKIVKENLAVDRLRRGCLDILKCRLCLLSPCSSSSSRMDSYYDQQQEQQFAPRLLSDAHGHGALFFACLNIAPGSTEMIKYMFRLNSSKELAQFGLPRWRDEIFSLIDRELDGNDGTRTTTMNEEEDDSSSANLDYQNRLQKIVLMGRHVARYRLKEKLSILELAVWKAAQRLEEPGGGGGSSKSSACQEHRQTCRTLCGADVITSNVLPFLSAAARDAD
ncbi:unnamed protein product [Cylindrotheca closterium]|uniref:Leucine-rich repeat protein n=1 Tax=Cylindrotheca closterium TaxID=2856 RepID=A0AAD2JKX2_9STRA|nr:unnamed protein product [Cylindrotheca closterium]